VEGDDGKGVEEGEGKGVEVEEEGEGKGDQKVVEEGEKKGEMGKGGWNMEVVLGSLAPILEREERPSSVVVPEEVVEEKGGEALAAVGLKLLAAASTPSPWSSAEVLSSGGSRSSSSSVGRMMDCDPDPIKEVYSWLGGIQEPAGSPYHTVIPSAARSIFDVIESSLHTSSRKGHVITELGFGRGHFIFYSILLLRVKNIYGIDFNDSCVSFTDAVYRALYSKLGWSRREPTTNNRSTRNNPWSAYSGGLIPPKILQLFMSSRDEGLPVPAITLENVDFRKSLEKVPKDTTIIFHLVGSSNEALELTFRKVGTLSSLQVLVVMVHSKSTIPYMRKVGLIQEDGNNKNYTSLHQLRLGKGTTKKMWRWSRSIRRFERRYKSISTAWTRTRWRRSQHHHHRHESTIRRAAGGGPPVNKHHQQDYLLLLLLLLPKKLLQRES
jgi:hypothetical protein